MRIWILETAVTSFAFVRFAGFVRFMSFAIRQLSSLLSASSRRLCQIVFAITTWNLEIDYRDTIYPSWASSTRYRGWNQLLSQTENISSDCSKWSQRPFVVERYFCSTRQFQLNGQTKQFLTQKNLLVQRLSSLTSARRSGIHLAVRPEYCCWPKIPLDYKKRPRPLVAVNTDILADWQLFIKWVSNNHTAESTQLMSLA